MEQQDSKTLFVARTRYLEGQCLVQQLAELVNAAQYALLEDNSNMSSLSELFESAGADAKLQQAGYDCPAKTIASLAKHLEAVHLAQRLQLPSMSLKPLLPTASSSSRRDVSSSDQLHGSKLHVLGITPLQLRKKHMPSKRAAQKAHAPILPCYERRLDQLTQAAIQAVAGADAGEDAAAHIVSVIQSQQSQLAAHSKACIEDLADFIQVAKDLVEKQLQTRGYLQTMLSKCILAEQPRLDKDFRDYLAAQLQSYVGKLQITQQALRHGTYTKDTVPALQTIKQRLDTMQLQTEQEIEQVAMQVEQYAQQSAEFHDVAAQYSRVKAEMEQVEMMLAGLRRVDEESNAVEPLL